jgi:hypothetical protein
LRYWWHNDLQIGGNLDVVQQYPMSDLFHNNYSNKVLFDSSLWQDDDCWQQPTTCNNSNANSNDSISTGSLDNAAALLHRMNQRHIDAADLEPQVPIVDIPDEMWLHIMRFVAANHLLACRLVCKRWRALATDRSLWIEHCKSLMASVPAHQEATIWDYYSRLRRDLEVRAAIGARRSQQEQHRQVQQRAVHRYNQWLVHNANVRRTCRLCNQAFEPLHNTRSSCVHHPGRFNVYIAEWTCCPSTSQHSIGCTTTAHATTTITTFEQLQRDPCVPHDFISNLQALQQ